MLMFKKITHDCTLLHLIKQYVGFTIACIVSQKKYLMSNTKKKKPVDVYLYIIIIIIIIIMNLLKQL